MGVCQDVVMRGIEPWRLAEMAKYFRGGGVGTYRGFTHVDTGRMHEITRDSYVLPFHTEIFFG